MQTNSDVSLPHRPRYWLFILVAAGLLCVILSWTFYLARRTPRVSIHFTGRISPGYHKNPFGDFILTNHGPGRLNWALDGVEAPDDPDLLASQRLDSNIPQGTLKPGEATNFPAMVPHTKDVPFRIHVFSTEEPDALDRLRAKLPWRWRIIGRRTLGGFEYTSQWFKATIDYGKSDATR